MRAIPDMRVILAGAFLFSGGCILTGPAQWVRNGFKVGPNYCRPPAPVAEQWIQAGDPHVQNRHLQDWWTVFNDPTLFSLIDTAYEQNPTLRVAGARVLQARAQQGSARGAIFPRTQTATGFYPFGTIAGNSVDVAFTGFNLSWEIDFWGRLRRGIESANAALDASVENYDDALVTLLADVATNYVQYRVAQQRIKIARANVAIQAEILALVERQQKVGINKVTLLDVNQARTVLEQTRSTIPALQIALGQANDTLCILLGMPPRELEAELGPGAEVGGDPVPNTPNWVAVGIPADLLRRRPDVRRAERQVAAQCPLIGVAEADLYPTLGVNGVLGDLNLESGRLFAAHGFLGFIIPNFRWNIFNYGRIVNKVRQEQARLQELIAAYQNQVLLAGREAQIALRSFLRSQEQAEYLARSVAAAGAALKIGRDQYRAGEISFNPVFNLETTQVQQQDQLAVARGNVALYLINVYRALGGGWELRYEKNGCDHSTLMPGTATAAPGQEVLPAPRPLTQSR